jgi:uncharacterized repeat protein (TIGR01451 family)
LISRSARRLAFPLLFLLGLMLVGATSAMGATRSNVTIASAPNLVSPGLGSDYGAYNFIIDFAGADDVAAGFVKGQKVGHCIESTLSTASTLVGTLRTGVEGNSLSLANADPNNLAAQAGGRDRLEWLLLSSRRALADTPAGAAANFELAAHQRAIWSLTNPSTPGQPANPAEPILVSPAFVARANQLLADSATYAAAVALQPSITATGAAVCSGAARNLHVTGAPLTGVTLAITSGSGQFANGAQQTTVVLGPNGTAEVALTGNAPGAVAVSGTFQVPTLVQAEVPDTQSTGQDFVYVEFRAQTIGASVDFLNCTVPGQPVPPAPPGSGSVTGVSSSTLSIAKAGPLVARAGSVVSYSIRVRNTSTTAASNVIVRDVIPAGYSLVKAVPRATLTKGRLTWRLGSLAAGATRIIKVSFRVDRTVNGQRCNNANASAANAPQVRTRVCSTILPPTRRILPAVTG